VPLSPAVVELLRKNKAAQAAERLKAGNQWTDRGLVFTTELGRPVDPLNLLRTIETAARSAGVEADVTHAAPSLCAGPVAKRACVEHVGYACSMSTMVQIRNVPDELLHELKARAAAQRMSLSDFLLARLAEIAEEPALNDVLDRLAALPRRDLDANAAELVGEARSE
jgi:antitoxin FitA